MTIYYLFKNYIKELLECAEGQHQVNSLNCLKGLPLRTTYVYMELYSGQQIQYKNMALVITKEGCRNF